LYCSLRDNGSINISSATVNACNSRRTVGNVFSGRSVAMYTENL
jgi:hypothetical protein